jgi:hypothetical protein
MLSVIVDGRQTGVPTARLIDADEAEFVGDIDSNSPALWNLENGRSVFYVVTSWGGQSKLTAGRMLNRLMVVGGRSNYLIQFSRP